RQSLLSPCCGIYRGRPRATQRTGVDERVPTGEAIRISFSSSARSSIHCGNDQRGFLTNRSWCASAFPVSGGSSAARPAAAAKNSSMARMFHPDWINAALMYSSWPGEKPERVTGGELLITARRLERAHAPRRPSRSEERREGKGAVRWW